MGLHSKGLLNPRLPIAPHSRSLLRHRLCPSNLGLLRHHHGRPCPLHRPPHHPLHHFVPVVFLPPEASAEFFSAGVVHNYPVFWDWFVMCLYQGEDCFGSCNSYYRGGCESYPIHILGCKERAGFQLPRSFLVWFSSCAFGVCPDSDFLPPGQVIVNDLWWTGGNHILWVHRL